MSRSGDYENPTYFNPGMTVFIDCRRAGIKDQLPGTGLKCTVLSAHGDLAIIGNDRWGFERWVRLDEVFVPRGTCSPNNVIPFRRP